MLKQCLCVYPILFAVIVLIIFTIFMALFYFHVIKLNFQIIPVSPDYILHQQCILLGTDFMTLHKLHVIVLTHM